mgnify:CR=1 FL=1
MAPSDRTQVPDATNRTGGRTWGFHERYTNDAEFRRQIDEGRKRAQSKRELEALKSALSMTREHHRVY